MSYRSSKLTLLTGASVAVLATTVGVSGTAVAQTAPPTPIEYTHSAGEDVWADGTTPRTGSSTNIDAAIAGDSLTLSGGTVVVNETSRTKDIGTLKSGNTAAGDFKIESSTDANVIVNIGQIQKGGTGATDPAVDLSIDGSNNTRARLEVEVENDAEVGDLTIDMSQVTRRGAGGTAIFARQLTTRGATQIKAGNSALGAVNAVLELKGNANLNGDVTLDDNANPDHGRAYLVLSGRADQNINGGSTTKIVGAANGEGTIKVLNGVEGGASNKANFFIQVGDSSTNRLRQLIVGDADKGGHAVFGDVYVNEIDVNAGNGAQESGTLSIGGNLSSTRVRLNDNGGGTAKLSFTGDETQRVAGDITTNRNNRGELHVDNTGIGGDNKLIFNGFVGETGRTLAKIDLNRGIVEFNNNVFGQKIELSNERTEFKRDVTTGELAFLADAVAVHFSGTQNQTVAGQITADGNDRGVLIVNNSGAAGSNRVTFENNVGSAANRDLDLIQVSDGIAQFNGNVFADFVTVNSTDGAEFKRDVTADRMSFGADDAKITLNGSVNQDVAGDILSGGQNNRGLLVVNNNGTTGNNRVTFENDVGSSAVLDLKKITLTDGIAQFNGNVFAQAIQVDSTDGTEFKRNVTTENLTFGAEDAKITLNGTGNQVLTGNIVSGGNDRGLLVVNNNGTTGNNRVIFYSTIGSSATQDLKKITLKNGVTELRGNVFANNIEVEAGNDGLVFNGKNAAGNATAQNVSGQITTGANNSGQITIINAARTTFNNQIGADDKRFNQISVGSATEAGKATFGADVFTQTLKVTGGDAAAEDSEAVIGGNLTGNVQLTKGAGDAKLVIGNGGATQITGNISAGGTGAGNTIVEIADNSGAPVRVTGNIGATNARLGRLTAGDVSNITFDGNVDVDIIDLNGLGLASTGTNFNFDFNGDVQSGTSFNLAGIATFAGDANFGGTGGLQFDGNLGRARFDGTTGQTVTGLITSVSGNTYGHVVVNNTSDAGVTFKNDLGTSVTKLNTLTLNADAKATLEGSAQFANDSLINAGATLTIGGAGRAAGASAEQEISGNFGGVGTIVVDNRSTDANGKKVTFNNNVTVSNLRIKAGATTFKGNVSSALAFANGETQITFGGTGNQEFSGRFAPVDADGTNLSDADRDNRGRVVVDSGGRVTFSNAVGSAADRDLDKITVARGDARFVQNVFAQDIEITRDVSQAEFKSNVTTEQLAFKADNALITLSGVGDQEVNGEITTDGDNRGRLNIHNIGGAGGNRVTFASRVGSSATRDVHTITVQDGVAVFQQDVFAHIIDVDRTDADDGATFEQSVTFGQDLKLSAAVSFKGNVTFGGGTGGVGFQFDGANGSATFDGTAAQRITGNITSSRSAGSANNYGDITVSNSAGVTFEGDLGTSGDKLNTLTLADNAKATFNGEVYLNGNLIVNNSATITLGNAFGARSGTAANAAYLTVAGLTTTDDTKLTVNLPGNVGLGMQKLFSENVTAAERGKIVFGGQNANFRPVLRGDGVLETKPNIGADTAAKYDISRDQGRVVEQAWEALKGDPTLIAALTRAGASKAGMTKFAQQVFPQTSAISGATVATLNVGAQVTGVFSDRLSAVRGSGAFAGRQTGFATGGWGLDKSFWLKPFGGWGRQSNNKTFAGYSTQSYGLATGFDGPVGEKSRLGVALAYSTSTIKGKGAGQDKTAVKGGSLSVYGGYTGNSYYVEGSVGYGRNDIATESKVLAMTRKASYDTNLMTASVGGGIPVSVRGGGFVTPTAGLSWTRVGSASYTTTGASKLNQKISVGSIDAIVGSVGAKVHKRIKKAKGTLVPSARLGVSYDFAGERTTASGKFTGGGTAFDVKGAKADQFAGTAGLGLSFEGRKWSVGADYDLNTRSGYTGHAARVNAKLKF